MLRYVVLSALSSFTLGGCQAIPNAQTSLPQTQTQAAYASAQPLSDAEMAQAMAAAERAQAMAPAVGAAGIAGGLDPTGIAQSAVNAEAERRMADLQRYMPGLVARNRRDADRMCASKPTQRELADACRQLAQAKAAMAAQGISVPGSMSGR